MLPPGDYPMEVILADDYHWTPRQIAELDPHYVDELMAYRGAKNQHQAYIAKKNEPKS